MVSLRMTIIYTKLIFTISTPNYKFCKIIRTMNEKKTSTAKVKILRLFHQLLVYNTLTPLAYLLVCTCELFLTTVFILCLTPDSSFRDTVQDLSLVKPIIEYLPIQGFYIFLAVISGLNLSLPFIGYFVISAQLDSKSKKPGYCATLLYKVLSLYAILLLRPLSLVFYYFYSYVFLCPPNAICWEGEHLAYSIVSVFGIFSVLITISLIAYLLPSDCYPESPRPWAGTMCYIGLPRMLTKLILAFSLASDLYYGVIALIPYLYFAFERADCKQFIYNKYVLAFGISSDVAVGVFALGASICVLFSLKVTSLGALLLILVSAALANACLTYKQIKTNEIVETPVSKIKSPNDLTVYFVKLLKACKNMLKSNKDRERLWAAICNHQENCATTNCECASVKLRMKEICKAYFRVGEDHDEEIENLQHKKAFVRSFLSILLRDALDSFGDYIEVRLLASYMEDYRLDNYIKGYFNIMKAEETTPSLAGELAIYMHRYSIERNIVGKKQDQGLDVKGVWLFEKLYRSLLEDISACVHKCIDFWVELLQTSINIARLYKKSIRISELYLNITSTVQEMLEIYPDHTGLLRDYANFLADVVNNDIEAGEYIEKASNAAKISAIVKGDSNYENVKYGYNSSAVTLAVSGNIGSTGIIENSNDKISQFGFSKSEVIGANISLLLPKFLGDLHDSFILNYFNTGAASLLNTEKILFIRHKSGYLEPIYLLIKCLPSLQEGLCFVGFIKRLANETPYLHPPQRYSECKYMMLVTDNKGCLLGFSKRCFKRLGLLMGLIYDGSKHKDDSWFSIKELNPDLLNPQLEEVLTGDGMEMKIKTGTILDRIEFERLSQEETIVLGQAAGTYLCYVQLIKHEFKNISFRVYKIAIIRREEGHKCSSLMFKVNPTDPLDSKLLDSPEQKSTIKQKKAEYRAEIFGDSSLDNTTAHGSSVGTTSSSFTKAVKEFKRQICNNITPQTIIYLNRAVIVLLLLLIGLSIFDLAIRLKFSDSFVEELRAISVSNNRRLVLMDLCAKTRSIVNVAAGLEVGTFRGGNRLERLLPDIKKNIEDLRTIQLQLDSNVFDITDKLHEMVKTRSVPLQSMDGYCNIESVNVTMSVATGQVIAYATQIINGDLSELKDDPLPLLHFGGKYCKRATLMGRATYFVLENCLGPLREVTLNAGIEYVNSALKNAERDETYLTIIMVCSVVFVLVCVTIAIPILVRAERNKIIALSIYSQLPIENANKMMNKCKRYIEKRENALEIQHEPKKLISTAEKDKLEPQSENSKDNVPKEELLKEDKKEEKDPLLQSAPSQSLIGHEEAFHKFRTNISTILFVLFSLSAIILGYMGIGYYLTKVLFDESKVAFTQVLDLTGRVPALALILTLMRELLIRNETYYYKGEDLLDIYIGNQIKRERAVKEIKAQPSPIIVNSIQLLRDLDSALFCDIATKNEAELKECEEIEGQLLANGIKNSIYYFTNMVITSRQAFRSLGSERTITKLKAMLNQDEHVSSFITKDKYINPAMWELQEMIFKDSKEYYENTKTVDISKAVAFIISLLLIIVLIWNSFISSLKKEVFRARGILNLIPTDFILNNDSIRKEVMRVISFQL
eukprot:TRINITY_DN732_c0_g1_i1.p1 TRINITY_DN732_c0_g1~~TRINITY_DN732_c0_g1_i1.p1  ORF type:complete len:1598 (+),score=155.57 TRINITY_DN732_c0_g1_i1:3349-8142(+)